MSKDRLDRESLLVEINRCLPAPIREETQLDGDLNLVGGDPGEVIVRINGNKVSIAVFSIRWDGHANSASQATRHFELEASPIGNDDDDPSRTYQRSHRNPQIEVS